VPELTLGKMPGCRRKGFCPAGSPPGWRMPLQWEIFPGKTMNF
jgi:hypothetical protein